MTVGYFLNTKHFK